MIAAILETLAAWATSAIAIVTDRIQPGAPADEEDM